MVGGYSQGGTLALDIATRYQDRPLGSVIAVATGLFDNNPSMWDNPKGDRSKMRIRTILGSNDIWFPKDSVMKNINKLASNYRLKKVGKWPEVLDASHLIFGDGHTDRIYDVIREEMNFVNVASKCSQHSDCTTSGEKCGRADWDDIDWTIGKVPKKDLMKLRESFSGYLCFNGKDCGRHSPDVGIMMLCLPEGVNADDLVEPTVENDKPKEPTEQGF